MIPMKGSKSWQSARVMGYTASILALLCSPTLTAVLGFAPPAAVRSVGRSSTSTGSRTTLSRRQTAVFVDSHSNNNFDLPPSLATWWSQQEHIGATGGTNAAGYSFSLDKFWSDLLNLSPSIPTTSTAASFGSLVHLPPQLQDLLGLSLTPWHLEVIALVGATSTLLYWLQLPDMYDDAPYEPGTATYDPVVAAEFYRTRPGLVLKRILRLALLTGSFNAGIVWDWLVLGKLLKDEGYTVLKAAEPRRAKIALRLCEQLGPTFIKLGQALSIRTDLIPEPYALELRSLQDAVPPFDSVTARAVLKEELGVSDLSTIFSSLSSEPVASASIGQVYKGTLAKTGQEVAVKVQRPGILSEIALDLHVLRTLTPWQTRLQNAVNGVATTQKDLDLAVALVDEWGRGFVAETDYRLEAQNTRDFQAAMESRELKAVCAPTVVTDLVTDRVLVTEWVTGTRLDRDASPDVPRLCGVAINAYLTMLLDTGVLHCDPHPGNLLRTTDGKLCVLDWGMTLRVPNNLQYALLELIAHINVENYDAIPQDFINLGFSPEGVTAERLKQSGITEGLTFAFRQLSAGGGPKKIQERVKAEFQQRYGSELSDSELREAARAEMLQRMEEQLASEGVDVKGVTNIMEEMSKRNRELFQLPPYVLYVARAFSTLEGIGLSIDENYAIVQECYPYLARRLFTDRSPRAKRALRAMLGLSEEVEHEHDAAVRRPTHNDDERWAASVNGKTSSALAVVRDGTATAVASSSSNSLSPGKLIEMSRGFTSYTAATANVDRDGAGQEAAARELAKLILLSPKGSTIQDILVEETVRFGDAATRAALRAALLENPAARAAKAALQTPKQVAEQFQALSQFLPGPLKQALLDRPAEVPELLETLLASNAEDERILTTAAELRDALIAQLQQNDRNGASSPRERVERLQKAASFLFGGNDRISPQERLNSLVTEEIPGMTAFGRRLGAGLLRRAAYRTDQTSAIPESTRKLLADNNRRLAAAIDAKDGTEETDFPARR
ncbi:hypothetical protein ACA910_014947 [Epithemia clementina (nom. ined.)]